MEYKTKTEDKIKMERKYLGVRPEIIKNTGRKKSTLSKDSKLKKEGFHSGNHLKRSPRR